MNARKNAGAGTTTRGNSAGSTRRQGKSAAPGLASERRDHLVKLAAELFARKGFQATTVREIAEEAGILSGSLYHHFDSKETIVDEVLSSFFDELISAYKAAVERGGPAREVLAELIRICLDTLEPHRAAITVMQNDWNYLRTMERFDYLAKADEEVERIWVNEIKRGQQEGDFRRDIDAKLTYRMIRDAIWMAVRWFRSGGRLSTSALADHYITMIFDGLCTGERTTQKV